MWCGPEQSTHHCLVLQGGASLISKTYLTDVAGIMAVEAYHAGAIRTLLFQNYTEVVQPYSVSISDVGGVRVAALLPMFRSDTLWSHRTPTKLLPESLHAGNQ